MMKFEHLLTETRHPDTAHIDQLSTREMLEVINAADRSVADAVHAELGRIAQAVDGIAERLEKGGRLFYTGAGTSGRLGRAGCLGVPADLQCRSRAGGGPDCRRRLCAAAFDRGRGRRCRAGRRRLEGPRSDGRGHAGGDRGQRTHSLCVGRHGLRQPPGGAYRRVELRARLRSGVPGEDRHHAGGRTRGDYRVPRACAPARPPSWC